MVNNHELDERKYYTEYRTTNLGRLITTIGQRYIVILGHAITLLSLQTNLKPTDFTTILHFQNSPKCIAPPFFYHHAVPQQGDQCYLAQSHNTNDLPRLQPQGDKPSHSTKQPNPQIQKHLIIKTQSRKERPSRMSASNTDVPPNDHHRPPTPYPPNPAPEPRSAKMWNPDSMFLGNIQL